MGLPLEKDEAAPPAQATAPPQPRETAPRLPLKQLVGIPLNVALFLLLMIMAWGSWDGFFSHPVRAGVVWVHLAMMPVMTLCSSGRSRGLKAGADWRPFFPLLVFHSLFTAWVMPYMDARDLWVLPGGDVLRWVGFACLTIGAALRVVSIATLGRRFSSTVALQNRHQLQTTGIYAIARHPSYLGILLMDVGFAGVFRSPLGFALLPLVFWMFKRRMDTEEAFMLEQFGDAYRDFMRERPRLFPRLY